MLSDDHHEQSNTASSLESAVAVGHSAENGTYVLLSRVTGGDDLLLLSSFPNDVLWHKPDQQFVDDMVRLRNLERSVALLYSDRIVGLQKHMDARDEMLAEQQRQREREQKQREEQQRLRDAELARQQQQRQRKPRKPKQNSNMLVALDWQSLSLGPGVQQLFESPTPTYLPVIPGLRPGVVRKRYRPGVANVYRCRAKADATAAAASALPIAIPLKPPPAVSDADSLAPPLTTPPSPTTSPPVDTTSFDADDGTFRVPSTHDLAQIFRNLGCKQVQAGVFVEARFFHEQVQFELDNKHSTPREWQRALADLHNRAHSQDDTMSLSMPSDDAPVPADTDMAPASLDSAVVVSVEMDTLPD